ncbi:DUF1587 domain-containing protein, partial [Arenicella sp.]|nr:DUF1587 domain-containing protein [Arenicella sp.]
MRDLLFPIVVVLVAFGGSSALTADEVLMENHCAECHNEEKTKGKFKLTDLGNGPTQENFERWVDALDLVTAEEMPPEDDSKLTTPERKKLAAWLDEKVRNYENTSRLIDRAPPRRLNNREFANSVRDVLLIEDIGTHQATDNLLGDTLHHGFDTHGESLGFSRFHLEQFIEAARRIVDATILSGEKPESCRYEIPAERIFRHQLSQNTTRPIQTGKDGAFEFLDPRLGAYFPDFATAPETGRYKIKIRCTGKDRHVYDKKYTGFYDEDPIQLSVHLGDRVHTFDMSDDEVMEIELNEWIAAGTSLVLRNPTDAFLMRGNGNFKFQYAIAPDHLKENDPERYAELVREIKKSPKKNNRRNIDTWHNWTDYWEGARPQVFSVEIEGPFYKTWPPERQVALIGANPKAENAVEILEPIAERAWRRPVREGELDEIVALVKARAKSMSNVDALKEGIVAILVSPPFLLLNTEDTKVADRFASKLSYFLTSTLPGDELRKSARTGNLDSFEAVMGELQKQFKESGTEEFLREFPYAWMELNDINFMSPDPDHYRFYHRKRLSE